MLSRRFENCPTCCGLAATCRPGGRRCDFRRPAFPPRPQLGFFERTTNQKALRLFASVAPEILELGDRLDAFGNDAKPQAVRQGDDRLCDCFIALVLLQATDKTLVDLDGLNQAVA